MSSSLVQNPSSLSSLPMAANYVVGSTASEQRDTLPVAAAVSDQQPTSSSVSSGPSQGPAIVNHDAQRLARNSGAKTPEHGKIEKRAVTPIPSRIESGSAMPVRGPSGAFQFTPDSPVSHRLPPKPQTPPKQSALNTPHTPRSVSPFTQSSSSHPTSPLSLRADISFSSEDPAAFDAPPPLLRAAAIMHQPETADPNASSSSSSSSASAGVDSVLDATKVAIASGQRPLTEVDDEDEVPENANAVDAADALSGMGMTDGYFDPGHI